MAPTDRSLSGGSYDAIVIGSGMGGLTTALLLARHSGRRVLVLERHTAPGGFTHTFGRKGWEWDVGVHYIGAVQREGSFLRKLFDHLSGGRLEWADVGEVYDTVLVAGQRFEFVRGRRAWLERLDAARPGSRRVLERYLELLDGVQRASRGFFAEKALPPMASRLAGWKMRRPLLRYSDRTVAEVLDGLTDDTLLKAVLTAQYGDYGLPPARASFAIHAMVAGHYLEGAGYPVGGAASIASTIVPEIEAAGGRVVTGTGVERILVEGGRAAGVRTEDGRELRAPLVVSDAGVANTARLLPEGAPGRRALLDVVRRVGLSAAHVCLYVGLDGSDEELDLGRSNLWVFPGTDHDAAMERYLEDPGAPLPVAFISFPSAKDPDFARRHPGRSTIEVVGWAPFSWFEAWRETSWRRRGEEYEQLKASLAERLLEVLYTNVPQVRGHVAYSELSTPLSTRHFAAYERGEIYGLDHTPQRFRERRLRPRTDLPGLFLTGQDVCTAGVSGALIGGVLATSAILRRDVLREIL